jgi:mono/diheme cytochrome c family protein
MKKEQSVFFCLLLLFVASCTDVKHSRLLSTNALPIQVFDIDPLKDTTLFTNSGVIVEISSNAIVSDEKLVRLEIKEAIELKDILMSGLTTNTGENLLSSQGMFYLSSSTRGAEIKKRIAVKVPVSEIIPAMKTFKGNYDKDSLLRWTEKEKSTLPLFDQNDISIGKQLFNAKCSVCHAIDKPQVGPALKGITHKRSLAWLEQFVRDYNVLLSRNDCEAIEAMYYSPSTMSTFPTLTHSDIKKIFAYVENDTQFYRKGYGNCYDSCIAYRAKGELLQMQKQTLLKQAKETQVVIKYTSPSRGNADPSRFNAFPSTNYLVNPNVAKSYYYTFEIDAFGWFNIDITTKDLPGLSDASLVVNVPDYEAGDLTVSLIVPNIKCFTNGGVLEGTKSSYVFMYKDGKIKLPIGNNGYVLAYGDIDGKFVFASQELIFTSENSVTLEPLSVPISTLQTFLRKVSTGDIKIKTTELETGKKLKAIDSAFEELLKEKPVNCSCNCSDVSEDQSIAEPGMSFPPSP